MLTPLIVFLSRMVLSFCVPRFLMIGQQELDAVVVDRQALLLEEVAELGHIVGANTKDREGLKHADMLRSRHIIRQLGLAATFQA